MKRFRVFRGEPATRSFRDRPDERSAIAAQIIVALLLAQVNLFEIAPLPYRGDVIPRGSLGRDQFYAADRVDFERLACSVRSFGWASDGEFEFLSVFFEFQPDLALVLVVDFEQGRKEYVVELEHSAVCAIADCGAHHLEVSDSGYHRMSDNSMLVEHPMLFGAELGYVNLAAILSDFRPLQQRMIDWRRLTRAAVEAGQSGGRHTNLFPRAPIYRKGQGAGLLPIIGCEGIKKGIGGGVINLAKPADHRAQRREEHQEIGRRILEHALEHASAGDLRRKDRFDGFARLQLNHASAGNSSGVNHSIEAAELVARARNDAAHRLLIGDIRG